jgi:hypothetical protein
MFPEEKSGEGKRLSLQTARLMGKSSLTWTWLVTLEKGVSVINHIPINLLVRISKISRSGDMLFLANIPPQSRCYNGFDPLFVSFKTQF